MEHPVSGKRLKQALIMVVDDVEMNRKILTQGLIARGFNNIVVAEDGSQALRMTRELLPDLVILDLMMPTMDGFAYCQAVREDKRLSHTPIIVQTALEDSEKKLKAFQLGATDYICKPIDAAELGARTEIHLAQKILMKDLQDYRERISAELDSARTMQNRLMPSQQQVEMCERVFDMHIGTHFETSSALGGDCWGIRPVSDTRMAIFMYDFSGHGITAALNVFRMHTIMQEFTYNGSDPGNFMTSLNRHLHPLIDRDEFATMFYGIIDTEANCLLYASAAVPSALVFTNTEKEPVTLDGRGFPLGVVASATYDTKYIQFIPGDMLLLYSDSLVETADADGEFLGEAQLGKLVQQHLQDKDAPRNMSQHIVDKLMQALRDHNASPSFADDVTIAMLRRQPKPIR